MMEVVGGNTGRFAVLYERYKSPVYGYFFKLTGGNSQISEDLSHNVFEKALRYKHSFKGTGTFAKWLFSIAHNLAIDHLRKPRRFESDNYVPEISDSDHSSEEKLELKENIKLLKNSIERLNVKDREVLIMAKIKELKYSEIAEIHQCSESAVKTRICRALIKLKDIFTELEESGYEKRQYQGKQVQRPS